MNYLSVIGLLAVIGFSSCQDEAIVVSSAVTVATKDSAVISGYVTAELNLQSAGLEAVPAGTSLLVSLPYSQLNSTATGNWLRTVTVGTDGKYTVKVPTNSNGVTVTITPSAFEYDQIQAYISGATVPTMKLTYGTSSSSVNVVSGQSLNKNLAYSPTNGIAVGVERVTISGKAQADLDASIIGLENLPDGTKIIFTANGWADSTSVTSGRYSMSVPKGSLVSWSINKIISTKVWNTNSDPSQSAYGLVNKTYAISGQGAFSANNLVNDIFPSGTTVSGIASLTTTISGSAVAKLDLSTSGNQPISTGTIYFYTSTWGASATVTNGNFNITIPAGTTVNYYIQVTANQKSQSGVITAHTFQLTSSVSGTNNAVYLPLTVPDNFVTTTVTGTAKAELDLTTAGLEYLPDGTKITFSTTSPAWSEAATVTNGTYAINLPVNATVYYNLSATTNQKSATGVITIHTFQANSSFYNYSNNQTINLTATAIN